MQLTPIEQIHGVHIGAPIQRDEKGNATATQHYITKYISGDTLALPGIEAHPEKKRKTVAEREEAARKRHKDAEHRRATARESKQREKPNKYRQPDPATPHETEFRHSAWQTKRKQVLDAMIEAGSGANAIANFVNCGAECIVCFDTKENRYFLQGKYCHSRFCEPCARAKANLLAANFREITEVAAKHTFRFFTLTLKHSDAPLRAQITKLRDSFAKLRKMPVWINNCTGGAGMLEIKYIADNGEWHPHLHCIIQGDHMQKQRLSDAWLEITGDSYVIDIKALDSRKDAAYYLAKYVAKGSNRETWECHHKAVEFIKAMAGQRTIFTFGCWRGMKLLAKPARRESWTRVGSLTEIVARMKEGEKWAIDILDHCWASLRYDPTKRKPRISGPSE